MMNNPFIKIVNPRPKGMFSAQSRSDTNHLATRSSGFLANHDRRYFVFKPVDAFPSCGARKISYG